MRQRPACWVTFRSEAIRPLTLFAAQHLRLLDPAAGDQGLEQSAVETAGGTVIDVLDGGLMAQPG